MYGRYWSGQCTHYSISLVCLIDITVMSWIISLNDSHVLFNSIVSRENQATTVSVITDRNDTMTVLACCKIQCNTCHQMASLAFRLHKIQFRPGLRPGPRWGSLRRSPRPTSRLGRGIPPLQSPPPRRLRRLAVDAFGAFGTEIPQLLKRRSPEREPPSCFKLL